MHTYEAVLIFQGEANSQSEVENAKKLFDGAGCRILKEEDMGNRELAGAIKKSKRGHYFCFHVESEPEALKSLEKSFKLRSEILRFAFFRKEP